MQMDSVQLELDSNIKNAEIVKTMVLKTLLKNNVISADIYEDYNSNFGVVIIKESWYKSIFSGKGWIYKFVKFN